MGDSVSDAGQGGDGDLPWRIWIDTGGTFTDCLARDPGGLLHRAKVLSSSALRGTIRRVLAADRYLVSADWLAAGGMLRGLAFRRVGQPVGDSLVRSLSAAAGELVLEGTPSAPLEPGDGFELVSVEEAPVLAARLVTRTAADRPLPPIEMRLATTRGTNALLERRGEAPVLFVTRGFRDLLRIGNQQRPDLFALEVRRPEPLFRAVVEVPERLAANGSVLEPLDLETLRAAAAVLVEAGARTAAVALMHAYLEPVHEQRLAALLREVGFTHVSASAELAPLIHLLHRAETAVVDAYLAPVIADYLERIGAALHGATPARRERATLLVMTSAGGLVRAASFRAKDSLLSGPAGGVVGAAVAGRKEEHARVIAFDMGGTSTDVARIDGEAEYAWEHTVGGAHLVAPALAIETVAAGGGSICSVDAQGLRVGPESAGATPGPACYGAGGPLTLTDVNLLLGRLEPSRFGIPIDAEPARLALERLRVELRRLRGETTDPEPLLEGLLAIADERMADAIRSISLRKGYDPAEYALVAFGGAGPQHACGVAERLGMRTVIVPADAGLLSALGLGGARLERVAQRQVLRPLDEVEATLPAWWVELESEAVAAVVAEGTADTEVAVRRRIAGLRYAGQEATLELDWAGSVPLGQAFEIRYREVYGHAPEQRSVELVSLRVIASTRGEERQPAVEPPPALAVPSGRSRAWWGAGPLRTAGGWLDVPVFDRADLQPGARFGGPALVWESHSATVVADGWEARLAASGALILSRHAGAAALDRAAGLADQAPLTDGAGREVRRAVTVENGAGDAHATTGAAPYRSQPAAIREELFVHRFGALVNEMGEQLRRTAFSVNVRERLDFSCALLDERGELVANAPHIPVHLGALGLCVREIARHLPMEPGCVVVTNHPAFGGSHLPDVTLIAPVHDAHGTLLGYVANRAHHAELGGSRPGSMPPMARTLAEEGVVIPPDYLLRQGVPRWDEIREVLTTAPFPSRAIEENLADLRAQLAAVHRGANLLRGLAAAHGAEEVAAQMRKLKRRASTRVAEALAPLGDAEFQATERLDDGAPLSVRITLRAGTARFDFTGSAPVHGANLNATPAIVRSAVLYVLRLLVAEPLPLNEGLLSSIDVRIPEGILNPRFPADPALAPAVVGGNVETSQRLVDTLLRALGLAACSQGTMNNVLFGSDRFGYYETVGGGAGAGPGWNGADAVHTHMTNTRITDPEILEHRYPVRVERFGIRRGSGGAGRWRGGDGAVRELRFLEAVTVSVLGQHRVERPYGMQGGEPGAAGRQRLLRADGGLLELAPIDGCEARPGDRLVLETPGGGGWGRI